MLPGWQIHNNDPAMLLWMENLTLRVLAVENILKQSPYSITDDQLREALRTAKEKLPNLSSPDLYQRAHALMSYIKG